MNDCENIATNTTLNTLIPDLNTAVFNQTAQDTYFTLAPNPMSTFTNIDFKINESIIEGNLLLYSIQGQLLKTYPIDGWQTITIEKADLNAGMYLLQYTNNNNVLQGGVQKLIIQ